MTMKPKYLGVPENEKVRRWHENLEAKSVLTATVYLRTLGYYCELNNTDPEALLREVGKDSFRNRFSDFIREMEKKGKLGSYLIRFRKVLSSWFRFNGIDASLMLSVNMKGEYESPTIANERILTKEELSSIIRKSSARGRVAISMMAFSGLRPESLGNYDGTDGLKFSDFPELKLTDRSVEFGKIPAQVVIRPKLSKARCKYFSFLGEEGCMYLKEYIQERLKEEESLDAEGAVFWFKPRGKGLQKNSFLRTTLVTRDIREAIVGSGLKMRPYVLRAYFSTGLDIAESKGMISHPWRQFIMGHKGDIEARYSTNKRLPPSIVEDMRIAYRKCLQFIETRTQEAGPNEMNDFLKRQVLLALDYKEKEIEEMQLEGMDDSEFQKVVRDRITRAMTGNGTRQKVVGLNDVEKFISEGYDFVSQLPGGKAIVKLPF